MCRMSQDEWFPTFFLECWDLEKRLDLRNITKWNAPAKWLDWFHTTQNGVLRLTRREINAIMFQVDQERAGNGLGEETIN